MRTPWTEDWQGRLANDLQTLGFGDVGAFVNARPGESFEQLAGELNNIAPVQLEMSYLKHSMAMGTFLEAAAECLARTIIDRLPNGWGVGVRLDYKTASAMAGWESSMLHDVEQSELSEDRLEAVTDALVNAVRPPRGWLPANGEDSLIQKAFEIGASHPARNR